MVSRPFGPGFPFIPQPINPRFLNPVRPGTGNEQAPSIGGGRTAFPQPFGGFPISGGEQAPGGIQRQAFTNVPVSPFTLANNDSGGGTGGNSFNQDLISEIFGERPELAFLGNLDRSGLRPNQQQFLRGRASDFLGRFEQAIGQQLAGGNLPTLLPEDFFRNLNFRNELGRFSPSTRGVGRSRLAPQTRFLR